MDSRALGFDPQIEATSREAREVSPVCFSPFPLLRRNFFDENAYVDRQLEGTCACALLPLACVFATRLDRRLAQHPNVLADTHTNARDVHTYTGINLKVLRRGSSDAADVLLDWLENGYGKCA